MYMLFVYLATFRFFQYGIEPLKHICEQVLISKITDQSVAELIFLADRHSAAELKKACLSHIEGNTSAVLASEGWKSLNKTDLNLVVQILTAVASKSE